ncbi:hypothetical protein EMPS_00417 [Entomortierella parvispora]|uniref:F-box domain-containing protein n=1 Tax=Entomortierella parvispora TaxID=205924 RepID=A0A9P3H0Y7_9FUNG|nr:hypothetical protein EMPS_00417 [Entomortierella parvispora]
MMATSLNYSQDSFSSPHHGARRSYSASSADISHRRVKSYEPNGLNPVDDDHELNSIPLTATHYSAEGHAAHQHQQERQHHQQQYQTTSTGGGNRVGRSLSLFRRQSRHLPGQVVHQGTVPPVPQVPILQHSGKAASRLLRLDDHILIRIARNFDLAQLMSFAHLSKRCRAITAKTLTLVLQRTVLKATLCQERKAVFSLEFIFQHLDPASLQAVFRASQLKSRRYFENSALARPVVQALTLVTPYGAHHPIFRLAGFDTPENGSEPMNERDLDRATTLLGRPFQLDIKDKGYYRVSPTTSCMVDTPFFPSQPLLDPLVPVVMEGLTHGPPSWEMMYKVDLNPPNYPQRVQQQQEKIHQDRVRQANLNGRTPPPPPAALNTKGPGPIASGLPPATGFVPLPAIKSGPNLRSILPEPSPLSGTDKGSSQLRRKPTVVRPPPEGWGPLPPMAPPPAVPASLAYQLGTRTVNPADGGRPAIHTQTGVHAGGLGSGGVPKSPTTVASCLEPELAEETERFLTLLFIQFPIQTLFPLTAESAKKTGSGGISGWMSKSKLGRSLTLKKTHGSMSVDYGKKTSYAPLGQ